jgi:hypothetical protein
VKGVWQHKIIVTDREKFDKALAGLRVYADEAMRGLGAGIFGANSATFRGRVYFLRKSPIHKVRCW